MKSAISPLELLEPASLNEALKMLRAHKDVTPIAGCTDVYVGLNFGTLKAKRFLNLWKLDGLRKIEKKRDRLSIGALATYTQMIKSPLVQRWIPMLVAASREVGGVQIQNRGTIGGNVANASPAGDSLPVLAAAEAMVVLAGADGERRVPFDAFYTGYRKTVMRPGELITAIEIPPLPKRQWFRKVGTRYAQAISKVVIACVGGKSPRIALGSVAPTVVRLYETEAVLAGGGSPAEARAALLDEINPIDDLRSTAEYRKRVSANLLEAWLAQSEK